MGDFLLLAQAATKTSGDDARWGTILALVVFIAASVWLGTAAQRVMSRGSFLKGFFLGHRGLGAWAIALTATVQSGGTFMGFPSLVYSYGWIVALWIGSYMVVPITGFGIVGKRIAQISRKTGAITMPDLFRERFGSPALGIVTSLLIVTFMSLMMVAQFKAGASLMSVAWPKSGFFAFAEDADAKFDMAYYVGLTIFSITVIGYTLIGGFLAAVWTDLFQSVLMFIGVMLLLFLSLSAAGGLESATRAAIDNPKVGPGIAFGPGLDRNFLPITLAVSFFFLWPAAGFSSPASVTRIMACKDTGTLRRSIVILCLYNLGIYLPLICICLCARKLMPGIDKTDEVIPRMAVAMTGGIPGGSLISGLILAAPFGAVMATVSAYLVVISSGLVRDVYHRFLNPQASERQLKLWTWGVMIAVGLVAIAANIDPPPFLQAIVVFSSSGAGSSFVVPCLMLCYWRRATAPGVIAAMLAGAGVTLGLYVFGFILGWQVPPYDPLIAEGKGLRPYFLLGFQPLVWGVLASTMAGIGVSLSTPPLEKKLAASFFDALPPEAPA